MCLCTINWMSALLSVSLLCVQRTVLSLGHSLFCTGHGNNLSCKLICPITGMSCVLQHSCEWIPTQDCKILYKSFQLPLCCYEKIILPKQLIKSKDLFCSYFQVTIYHWKKSRPEPKYDLEGTIIEECNCCDAFWVVNSHA